MQADVQSEIDRVISLLQEPSWHRLDFWLGLLGLVVGIAGLVYSIRAFREAGLAKDEAMKAKKAATDAGKTVRVQTLIIELTEIPLKLQNLPGNVRFGEARELLNEVSWRLQRAMAPFEHDVELRQTITSISDALDATQNSLKGVRPSSSASEGEAPGAVFNAVEDNFMQISKLVARLLGLLEKKILSFGETHVQS